MVTTVLLCCAIALLVLSLLRNPPSDPVPGKTRYQTRLSFAGCVLIAASGVIALAVDDSPAAWAATLGAGLLLLLIDGARRVPSKRGRFE